jgi:hypothetical protein
MTLSTVAVGEVCQSHASEPLLAFH